MSWEEMYTDEAVCPCGKGKITQKHYGDDWNRSEDGQVVIECEECAKKYKIETITHYARLSSDGSWSEYFLTPKDYPAYSGTSEAEVYGSPANPNWNYTGWLIENFTESQLKDAETQLHNTKSSAKLTGVAAEICASHKKAMKTVRVSAILDSVEKALKEYPEYVGNKLQREEIRKKESDERTAYNTEKRKHQVKLELQRI